MNKVEAVYQLREAAEAHGRAEAEFDKDRSPENVDALLEAKELLEVKTVEAIEACEHCAQSHCEDPDHKRSKVINVEFGSRDQGEGETG